MSAKLNDECERPNEWTECLQDYCNRGACNIWSWVADEAYFEYIESERDE